MRINLGLIIQFGTNVTTVSNVLLHTTVIIMFRCKTWLLTNLLIEVGLEIQAVSVSKRIIGKASQLMATFCETVTLNRLAVAMMKSSLLTANHSIPSLFFGFCNCLSNCDLFPKRKRYPCLPDSYSFTPD